MNTPFNVLSLEDSDLDFEIISEQLIKAGYNLNISRAETENEFTSLICNNKYDIILADYNLPQFDAFEALKICNLHCPDIPVICVSGSIGEIMAIELLKMGAVDYVIKDRLERLPFAVKRALEEANEKKARMLAEEELKKKEINYRTLTENIPDIITRLDKDLRHIYINPAIEKATGLVPSDYIGKTNEDLGMPPEKVIVWNEYLHYAFETAKQQTFEFDFQTPDGIRYFSSLIVPELDEDGKVRSVLTVARDISEHKLAEIALKKSEERLRDIIFSTADWVWEVDEKGRYTYSSQRDVDLFNVAPDEIIGKTPFDFMPAEEAEKIANIFSEIIANKEPIKDLENWNVGKDGKLICLLTNGLPILDNEGNLIGYRGVDKNITEKKNSEEIIRQSEAKLSYSQQIAKMGSWDLNLLTNKYTWSKNLYSMLDYKSTDEVMFDDFIKLVHPDDRKLIDFYTEEIIKTKAGVSFDFRYAIPGREIIWVQNNIEPVFRNDELIELHGVNIDITDKKLAEQELITAKEKAEASDRLKTAFMNNISHEIRTPLNGILGFGQILTDPTFSDVEKEGFYRMLNDSCDRLLNTVTNIMDVSLLTSGNQKIYKEEFNIDKLISGVYDKFEDACNQKNLAFSIQKKQMESDPKIYTDESMVSKIISQLIDNAIKFTSTGTIEISYEMKENTLFVSVKDSGIGISEKNKNQIFGNFIQEDNANTRKYEGTGIGLSIVKGLTEILGGRIFVESEKGKGSTFSLSIPLN